MPFSRLFARLTAILCLGLSLLATAAPAQQENPFRTVARVNDTVVTRFEVAQRGRLLQLLRTPGLTERSVLDQLIDARLQLEAARSAGIVPTQEDVDFGIEDFAARANLTGEELLIAVADVGIAEETVRDYITVLIAWGELVRERFATRARPSEAEIDRALAFGSRGGSARVLVSEIVLPLTPQLAAVSEERANAIAEIDSIAEFSSAARRFSVAPSRNNGGQLAWQPISDLPPQLTPMFLTMQAGDVTPPILVDGGIALFQLRALEDGRPTLGAEQTVDYMRLALAPGNDPAAVQTRLRAEADVCDDLYGLYREADETRLARRSGPRAEIPAGLRGVLDRLDPGETAVVGDGGALAVVMLCSRSALREEDLDRDNIRQQLFARNLEALGEAFLAELRAAAFIERSE